MKTKKLIDALRVCADDDIICPACERYESMGNKGGTAECVEDLMLKAAERLKAQQKRIEELEQKVVRMYAADNPATKRREFYIEWCDLLYPEEAMEIFVRNAERILKGTEPRRRLIDGN